MADDTLTLAVEGEITLDILAKAIQDLDGLMVALRKDVERESTVVWVVETLAAGSAITTFRGESETVDAVPHLVRAFATVGRALQENKQIPFSPPVARRARDLTGLLNGRVTAIRFETAEADFVISKAAGLAQPRLVQAYGAVQGHVQTLTDRRALRFVLYDEIHDRPVSCYIGERQPELIDLVRAAWRRDAIVEGVVSRDVETGYPIAVRRISNIDVLPSGPPGAYQFARGVLAAQRGRDLPEDLIRRGRDAE